LRSLGALFTALAIVIAAALLSGAWKKSHPTEENSISVTGLASKDFQSDLIVWSGSFSRSAPVMKDAYEQLKRDAETLKSYLVSKGIKESEIVFSAVDINRDFEDIRNDKGNVVGQKFTGFTLKQSVSVSSHDVDRVESVSRVVTELIEQGVELYSNPPAYYYTKLAELKLEMLSAATQDARSRAEKIATNAKSGLARLRNASMGVFQITAQNSAEDYTSGGTFNTSAKWKTASITVRLEFELE
jgi:hypothetical protein